MINKIKQRRYSGLVQRPERSLFYIALGIFFLIAGGALVFNLLKPSPSLDTLSKPINYRIQQSVEARPRYNQSSFFGINPEASNTAYLTDLTDTIEAQYHYKFEVSETADITYQYQATALIRALYGSDKSVEGGMSNVWSKQYTLSAPVKVNRSGTSLTLNPVISIPFAEYKKKMEQFRNAFSTPTNSELVVTYSVQLTGNVRGAPITETKESVITVPLDQQIYKLSSKFEKDTHKEILAGNNRRKEAIINKAEIAVAILLIAAGLACAIYGLRKQKTKSSYQRDLEKIYRYHDGIIIHAKLPPKLEKKNIVIIKSFDDMLNLEEELKKPIIASKVSDYTTHFFITHDDIVYVYTVGTLVPFSEESSTDSP